MLHSTFDSLSIANILQINIPPPGVADKLVWSPDFKGLFAVKSAYRQLSFASFSALGSIPSIDWKKLWRLNMHKKLKFLLWKVAQNILPSLQRMAMNLQSSFQGQSNCLICGDSSESLHYLLFSCSYSRLIWRLSPWGLNVEFYQQHAIEEWIQSILDPPRFLGISTLDCHLFQLFAVLMLDLLWMARNKMLHEGIRYEPLPLLQQILHSH